MKKTLEKNSGITLIALVVTIIVLLILASISITVILGDNGLIAQAQAAEEATEKGAKQDEEKIKDLNDKINTMVNGGAEGGGPTTPDEPTLKVKLTVDEAKVTGTTIPVTAKVTTIDGDTEVTKGITYEFYQNNEKNGDSSEISEHTFNSLEETTEYTLKVIAKDVKGETVEDTLTVGAFSISGTNFRYTLGMTWGDFLDSKYPKELGEDGACLQKITKSLVTNRMYGTKADFEVVGVPNDLAVRAIRFGNGASDNYYIAIPDCPCGLVAELPYRFSFWTGSLYTFGSIYDGI